MPMTTGTLVEPKVFPTTVGIVEKKPPFAMPLIMVKTINGPREVEKGHNIIMLSALNRREINSVFNGPKKSQQSPQSSLPSAEEKLNAATMPAPVLDDIPSEAVNKGRKNGGTSRGKVAIAPTAKRRTKRTLRNKRLPKMLDIYTSTPHKARSIELTNPQQLIAQLEPAV